MQTSFQILQQELCRVLQIQPVRYLRALQVKILRQATNIQLQAQEYHMMEEIWQLPQLKLMEL